jgi:hypothetical protein
MQNASFIVNMASPIAFRSSSLIVWIFGPEKVLNITPVSILDTVCAFLSLCNIPYIFVQIYKYLCLIFHGFYLIYGIFKTLLLLAFGRSI